MISVGERKTRTGRTSPSRQGQQRTKHLNAQALLVSSSFDLVVPEWVSARFRVNRRTSHETQKIIIGSFSVGLWCC